jgi:hypothetical protein
MSNCLSQYVKRSGNHSLCSPGENHAGEAMHHIKAEMVKVEEPERRDEKRQNLIDALLQKSPRDDFWHKFWPFAVGAAGVLILLWAAAHVVP